jgi:molybdopterin synthase sulfur carrier subunit
MRITVRLFARLRDISGAPSLECDVPAGATVSEVWSALADEWPALGPHRASVAVAVNEEFARFSTRVQDGDVVAFLPPVSGG